MLAPAILYKEQLEKLYHSIWFDDKYKYYNYDAVWSTFNVCDKSNDWHEFVSIDKDGQILGVISYYIVRSVPRAQNLGILSFVSNSLIFGRDVLRVIQDIFEKFNLLKLNFSVVIGNPIEKTYDKLCAKYGGDILCIEKNETRLQDNQLYDVKRYVIDRENYLASKYRKKSSKKIDNFEPYTLQTLDLAYEPS